MDTLMKALLYVGTILTVGAGVFAWFVGPEHMQGASRRRAWWGLTLGASIVFIVSPLHVALSIIYLVGYFDPVFGREYLFATRHGTATLLRMAVVAMVVALTLWPLPRPLGRALFTAAAVGLLSTFSWTSHAVAVGGALPLLTDLVHFAAAAAWSGAVLYTAWLPLWRGSAADTELLTSVRRVSGIGLASVLVLFVTGIYTALLHVRTPEILSTSPYGRALILKNVLVLVIVALAAVNRWWFLPGLEQPERFRYFSRMFRAEALLLLAVLALTGLLTTSALPHEAGVQPNPLESLLNFIP